MLAWQLPTSLVLPSRHRISRPVRFHCSQTTRHPASPTPTMSTSAAPEKPMTMAPGLQSVPEISEPIALPVTGTLPSYLSRSTLYRMGPGRFEATHSDGKVQNIRHWFDGYSLVHSFAIDASTNAVTYRSRFTCAGSIRAAEATPKSRYSVYTFGSADPCRSILGKFFQLWTRSPIDPVTGKPSANINVTIQNVPGKGPVTARTDFNANVVLDPDTLEEQHFFRFTDLDPALKGAFSAAHGHFDEDTGEFFNYTYDLNGPGPVTYNVFRIDKTGNAQVLASFSDSPSYIHSFATTENYVVMCLWPLQVDALKIVWNKSLMDGMTFYPDKRTKFIVVSRSESRVVATYDAPSFFCFHTINAFEKDDAIHIDLCKYKDAAILDEFMLEHMRNGKRFSPTSTVRFSLDELSTAITNGPTSVRTATESVLNDKSLELPRVHPNLMRKDYRFVYGVSDASDNSGVYGVVAKVDVVTGERESWFMENGIVGEPIFVPDPSGKDEDEGVLLIVVLNVSTQRSSMVVVDAKTMTEVARASVPQAVPLGFHGKFNFGKL